MSVYLTPHFSVAEMACHDGTPYPIDEVDEDDPDKRPWLITRLMPLLAMLETIREACCAKVGRAVPVIIDSGYRTLAYDGRLYDKEGPRGGKAAPEKSQHPKGRAADIRCPSLGAAQLHKLIGELYAAGKLPQLGGLGLYPSFVHVDCRPKPDGHLAQWGGSRLANVV